MAQLARRPVRTFWLIDLRPTWPVPHDPPGQARRSCVAKACRPECGGRAHVGVEARAGVDWIALDYLGALRSGVLDRGLQKTACNPLPADLAIDEEADHRPDGRIVDTEKATRPFQRP